MGEGGKGGAGGSRGLTCSGERGAGSILGGAPAARGVRRAGIALKSLFKN